MKRGRDLARRRNAGFISVAGRRRSLLYRTFQRFLIEHGKEALRKFFNRFVDFRGLNIAQYLKIDPDALLSHAKSHATISFDYIESDTSPYWIGHCFDKQGMVMCLCIFVDHLSRSL